MNVNESPDEVTVSGLFLYPLKSCRAISLPHAQFATTGIAHDRSWMLVDARSTPQRFITQRDAPILATVDVNVDAAGELTVSHVGSAPLRIAVPANNALAKVQVWGSEVFGLDAGDEAAAWFANMLGRSPTSVRLVQFYPQQKRLCSTRYAGASGAHTLFADGYPVLVTNENSLADLNARIGRTTVDAIPMNRFRPNLVLRGLPAWDEDHVDTIRCGALTLKLVKPCVRCVMTTTDQMSGTRVSDEPLHTLARYRRNSSFGGVTFGWNAIVTYTGTVNLGDSAYLRYRI